MEGYDGSLAQYVGQPLELTRVGDSFELRWEDDLLGRLTRPDRFLVAETRDGRWELRHGRRSMARIDAVESETTVARYKQHLFRPGASVTGRSSLTYRLRQGVARQGWVLSGSDGEILGMKAPAGDVEVELTIHRDPADPSDLTPVAMLCTYVALLSLATYVPTPSGGGPLS
jgi:hypothetical protein